MKKLLLFGLLIALAISVPAIAQSAFDGTWKFNLNDAQFPKKPDVFLLQDGMYHCKTCVPPIDVKADGQDQPVKGHPYYDTSVSRWWMIGALRRSTKRMEKR